MGPLADAGGEAAARLVLRYFPGDHAAVLAGFAAAPERQFRFLRGALQARTCSLPLQAWTTGSRGLFARGCCPMVQSVQAGCQASATSTQAGQPSPGAAQEHAGSSLPISTPRSCTFEF